MMQNSIKKFDKNKIHLKFQSYEKHTKIIRFTNG